MVLGGLKLLLFCLKRTSGAAYSQVEERRGERGFSVVLRGFRRLRLLLFCLKRNSGAASPQVEVEGRRGVKRGGLAVLSLGVRGRVLEGKLGGSRVGDCINITRGLQGEKLSVGIVWFWGGFTGFKASFSLSKEELRGVHSPGGRWWDISGV